MAIAGLLVHCEAGKAEETEEAVKQMTGFESHGIHDEHYVVVVAEFPSGSMEDEVKQLEELAGVLTVYTTYLNIEDELAS